MYVMRTDRKSLVARLAAALLVLCAFAGAASAMTGPASRDRAYWEAIVRQGFAVPSDAQPFALAHELSVLLSSPDPDLRDRLAFGILSVWLNGETPFSTDELTQLQREWQTNLRKGIGQTGTDSVLERSFSALCLAALVARDRKQPFLDVHRYHELLAAALEFLASERDLRGFDERKGWIHATAHAADLLAELSRHPQMTAEEQGRVLAGVALRLAAAPEVFTQGEQDRLAQAVAAVVRRQDFDGARFDAWLVDLVAARRQSARKSPQTTASLAAYQNATYFLQALCVRLSAEPGVGGVAKARDSVLGVFRPRWSAFQNYRSVCRGNLCCCAPYP